jgi:hypothetical protein
MADVIGDFRVRGRTYLRDDETGQFLSAAAAGANLAVEEIVGAMADIVRGAIIAMTDVRTGELQNSVDPYVTGQGQAQVIIGAAHGAPLNMGAVAHWIPNAFGSGRAVWHPGNKPPMRFMEQAEHAMLSIAPEIVRRNMPNTRR